MTGKLTGFWIGGFTARLYQKELPRADPLLREVIVCPNNIQCREGHTRGDPVWDANSKHWFTTSFLWRSVSAMLSLCGCHKAVWDSKENPRSPTPGIPRPPAPTPGNPARDVRQRGFQRCRRPLVPATNDTPSEQLSQRVTHTPSIAFGHLPPKEVCRKPVPGF